MVAAKYKWRGLLDAGEGRKVVCLADNDVARFGLICGYTPPRASAWLLTEHWRREMQLWCNTWFDRVASQSSPADEPSRLDFKRWLAIAEGRIKDADPSTQIQGFCRSRSVRAPEAQEFVNCPTNK